jgi:hypothetical protein
VRNALLTIYTLACVYVAGSLLIDNLPARTIAPMQEFHGDCLVDAWGARAWSEHWDPYSPEGLKRAAIPNLGHPPTTPAWFLPLWKYEPRTIHGVVGHLVLAMLLVMMILLASELGAPVPLATAVLAFAFVVSQTWMQYHLAMIQIGTPCALLYVLSWYFLRRGRELAGGAMMGLALTLKFFPGLLMVFFLATRRWRAFVAGCVAWLAVAVPMTWRYGLASWSEYFAKQPEVNNYWASNIKNGGLPGVVLRMWWPSDGLQHGPNLPAASALSLAASVLIVLWAWRISRGLWQKNGASLDGPFALFAALSVFLNPVVWEHYFVLVPFPFAVAAAMLWGAQRRGLSVPWTALGAAVLAATVWMLNIDIGMKQRGLRAAGSHLVYHAYEMANWIFWPALAALLGALTLFFARRQGYPERLS